MRNLTLSAVLLLFAFLKTRNKLLLSFPMQTNVCSLSSRPTDRSLLCILFLSSQSWVNLSFSVHFHDKPICATADDLRAFQPPQFCLCHFLAPWTWLFFSGALVLIWHHSMDQNSPHIRASHFFFFFIFCLKSFIIFFQLLHCSCLCLWWSQHTNKHEHPPS